MAGINNFLIFNEANNPNFTMSDANYASDLYRINGLIPMIADPIAHNKMYRQWSIMVTALANIIASMDYNASDSDLATLQANLKSTIEDVAEAKVNSRISTLENWKSSITATPAELNILDGVTASTSELNILDGLTASTAELNTLDGITASTAELNTLHGITASTAELNILDGVTATASELNILDGVTVTPTEINYLSGASSNIQTQIDNLNISALFPLWIASRAYSVGDVVKTLTSSFWVYLECVVAGTSDTTEPTFTNVGELVTDGTAKWLVLDMRDSAPVGSIKHDLIKRDGWLKLNGATVNIADYPRLVSFLTANSLLKAYTATPNVTEFTYGDSNNETLILPDFNNLFIESCLTTPYVLEEVSAGLPNITGSFPYTLSSRDSNSNPSNSGACYYDGATTNKMQITQATYKGWGSFLFDASRSNSIYGNSSTVQPPAVKLIPIIKY